MVATALSWLNNCITASFKTTDVQDFYFLHRFSNFSNPTTHCIPDSPVETVTFTISRTHIELNDLYSSLNIVRVIKSRRMKRTGHMARMGVRRGVYRVLVGKPEGKNHLGDPDVDERIILRWIFRQWDVGVWTGSS
jgi:hypothetical protein